MSFLMVFSFSMLLAFFFGAELKQARTLKIFCGKTSRQPIIYFLKLDNLTYCVDTAKQIKYHGPTILQLQQKKCNSKSLTVNMQIEETENLATITSRKSCRKAFVPNMTLLCPVISISKSKNSQISHLLLSLLFNFRQIYKIILQPEAFRFCVYVCVCMCVCYICEHRSYLKENKNLHLQILTFAIEWCNCENCTP